MVQYLTREEAQSLGAAPPEVGAPLAAPSPSPAHPEPVEGPCHLPFQRIEADTVISRAPVLFWGAILTSDGVGATEAIFYDGVNANGRRLFRLLALITATLPLILPKPILLEAGLYVDVGSNLGDLFVLYSPLPG
jgi:hypothetical protein